MNGIRSSFYRFMSGRYGNDQLNNFLLIFVTIVLILNAVTFNSVFISVFEQVIIIYILYRALSKNFSRRYVENNNYLKVRRFVTKRYTLLKKQLMDMKHVYYICPNCNQIVRVPRGKGKIIVTCAKCRTKFEKRS